MSETNSAVEGATLGQEDTKIVTLARSARARIKAAEGAAVRDTTGRTYAACTVALPSLSLTALQAAVAAAVAAGARDLEAAAVVTESIRRDDAGTDAVRDLSTTAPIFVTAPDGTVKSVLGGPRR